MEVAMKSITGSSSVEAVGYIPAERAMLVEYKPNGVYHYDDISQENYDSIFKAESAGKQIKIIIKDKPYRKL